MSFAQNNSAMFGLEWGQSPAQVIRLGVDMSKTQTDKNFHIYSTVSLPKNPTIAESYNLIFDGDSSLVKVVMVGKTIDADPYGTDGKEAFEAFNQLLAESYTLDKTHRVVGMNLYEESDEFYQCLKYPGCGLWMSLLNSPNKIIGLQLEGLQRGEGYLRLTVEAVPGWRKARETYMRENKKTDRNALQ